MVDVSENYEKLMLSSIKNYIEGNIVSENFVKTIRYIRECLYNIDSNPRPATLILYLEYNLPFLKNYGSFIWFNLRSFESYESQLN
jgi:hypothetical protein